MDELMTQIASNAGDYAVDRYGFHLAKPHQIKLWHRYYDSVLAALMTYEEFERARRVRAHSIVTEK